MSRKVDPTTRYRVRIHNDRNYIYASVQETTVSSKTGKKYPKTINLGTLDENYVFTPNATFRLMPLEERSKYIFPEGWDISSIESLNPSFEKTDNHSKTTGVEVDLGKSEANGKTDPETDDKHDPRPSSTTLDQFNNKLYGGFWLLEQLSRDCGLYDDLLKTFKGNYSKVHEVLSLAFFPYLSGKNYSRFAKWQNTNKTLVDYPLKPYTITRIAQSITDDDRMSLIRMRLERLPDGARLDCDSTSRSAWGKCLADIRWGKNKDNSKLRNTVEVVVYSLTTHEPVYYRSFPGNTSDMSTIRTILSDLNAVGIKTKDIMFITDRGYTSIENIAAMVSVGLSFVVCSKTCAFPVIDELEGLAYDEAGLPLDMQYDSTQRLYYTQVEIPAFTAKLSDGTPVRIGKLKANLFLNPRNRIDELGALRQDIDKERAELIDAVEKGFVPKSIKKYNALFSYFKVTLKKDQNKNPVGIQYVECSDKIKKEKALCGFFSSLMYRMELTAREALQTYKERDEQEKNFDQMKNQMHFRVQRCSAEDSKNGMSFIMFVGLIPISKLRHTWRNSMSDDYASTLDMLDEMEPIRFSEYTDGNTHMTSFTTKQVTISRACNIEPPLECIPKTMRITNHETVEHERVQNNE